MALAPEPPAVGGSADAGIPNAAAGAQFAASGTTGSGPGASLAGTLGFGLILLLASAATSFWYLSSCVCQVASAVHCVWHVSAPD
jgi:hypothetical protein